MQPTEIICANCGWHNEPSAMMCGGCGRPLPAASSLAGGRSAIDLEDTIPDVPTVQTPTVPARVAEAPASGPRPTQRRRGRRLLTGCLITLAILLVVAIGTWIVIIRPVAHTIADDELRVRLENVTSHAPILPPGTVSLTESQVDGLLAGRVFGRIPVRSVNARFRGGTAGVTYSLPITGGSVTTKLVARDGRLFAEDTHVEGLAGLIESGDELQVTLNEALALLPAADYVGSVSAKNGTLTVTIVQK